MRTIKFNGKGVMVHCVMAYGEMVNGKFVKVYWGYKEDDTKQDKHHRQNCSTHNNTDIYL